MLWVELDKYGRQSRFQMGYAIFPLTVLAPFVLSAAVSVALTTLVAWHAFIIYKGQVCNAFAWYQYLCAEFISRCLCPDDTRRCACKVASALVNHSLSKSTVRFLSRDPTISI